VAAFLTARGHNVEVVITADAPPPSNDVPVRWVPRTRPPGVRHVEAVKLLVARARRANVVYTTGMFGRSSVAAQIARVPLVVKLTADPAYERARRWRLYGGTLEAFQSNRSVATLPLRALRDWDVRRARHVITPSSYLRDLALQWGLPPDRASVLPNPAPPIPPLPPRSELRQRFGFESPTLVFAGRLTTQKSLEVGIEAARRAGVALVIAGDGPDRAHLERLGHARFLGALPRDEILGLFAAADASLLSSSWENFPHSVVEALAVGTPVIATRVGGVGEVVHDGENGLVVEPDDVDGLTEAIRRFFADAALAERLRTNAAASVTEYGPERIYGRLEEILLGAAR
jgi:glycosyltransferase involved in cell wall biosynthesis